MLRRALHAAADSIEPDADGLNRIRSRLKTPRSVLVACAMAMWARLAMRIPDAAWTAGAKLTRERHHIAGGLATTRSPNSSRPERPRSWHRPAAALATAAFVVAFGVWAAMSVPAMTRPGGSLSAATGNGSGGGGGANTAGTEGHGSKARRSSPEPGRTTSAAACPTRSPAGGGPAGVPSSSSSPSSTPSQTASPTPTPTGSSTPSPTPTPTPSDSTTPTPGPSLSSPPDASTSSSPSANPTPTGRKSPSAKPGTAASASPCPTAPG